MKRLFSTLSLIGLTVSFNASAADQIKPPLYDKQLHSAISSQNAKHAMQYKKNEHAVAKHSTGHKKIKHSAVSSNHVKLPVPSFKIKYASLPEPILNKNFSSSAPEKYTKLSSDKSYPANPSDKTDVSVPQLSNFGLELGITGLNLKPMVTNDNLAFALISNPNTRLISIPTSGNNIWSANVRKIFDKGSDINFSYLTFDQKSHNLVAGDGITPTVFPITIETSGFNNPPFLVLTPVAHTTQVEDSNEFDLDQADLTLGQTMNTGKYFVFHPFTGLRYAQIKQNENLKYSGDITGSFIIPGFPPIFVLFDDPFITAVQRDDKFKGIGPTIGFDTAFEIDDGFSLTGHLETALLVGNVDSKLNIQYNEQFVNMGGSGFTYSPLAEHMFSEYKANRIVPDVNAKLGGKFKYTFQNAMAVSLEAGYSYSEYFGALDQLDSSAIETFTPFERDFAFGAASHKASDLAIYGPYFNLIFSL